MTAARIIVSGGRGLKSPENFQLVWDLARVLGAEVGGHLETVDAWLAQARAGDGSVNDGLLRAIHTLNGAFAMTEIGHGSDVASIGTTAT